VVLRKFSGEHKRSRERRGEFQEASLPGYELGSKGF
jgi:hypothetical protein